MNWRKVESWKRYCALGKTSFTGRVAEVVLLGQLVVMLHTFANMSAYVPAPTEQSMPRFTRRQLLIAIPLGLLLLAALALIVVGSRNGLRSRLAKIHIGMTQAEVEAILGPPVIHMSRTNGRGHLSVWVDQFWQVDVITGPDGRVERVSCAPSDSAYHRTIGRLMSLLGNTKCRESFEPHQIPSVVRTDRNACETDRSAGQTGLSGFLFRRVASDG